MLNDTRAELPILKNRVITATHSAEIRSIIDRLIEQNGYPSTKELSMVDEFFNSRTGVTAYDNVKRGRAGYLPLRRVALALILIAKEGGTSHD